MFGSGARLFEGVDAGRVALEQVWAESWASEEAGAGAALLYSLNRNHAAADAVLILTTLRGRLIERLGSEIDSWEFQPLHASLFGSTARADGDTDSDIDVFLVRPLGTTAEDSKWRRQVERLPDLIHGWTGNHAGIMEVSRHEVDRMGGQSSRNSNVMPFSWQASPSRTSPSTYPLESEAHHAHPDMWVGRRTHQVRFS